VTGHRPAATGGYTLALSPENFYTAEMNIRINGPSYFRSILSAVVISAVCVSPLAAADKVTVLKAARMFDGKSKSLAQNGVVIVQGSKIVDAGSNLPAPEGAQVIDLGDVTLSPGFMDAHTHLSMDMTDNWNQDQLDTLQRTVAEQALRATEFVKKTLWAGFTTPEEIPVDLRARLEAARLDLLALFRALDRLDLSPAEIPQRLIRQLFELDAD
jgi:hypothetical protein